MNCGNCKEALRDGLVNHIIDIDNKSLVIQGVPAKICSQCGEYYFTTSVMLKLETLIQDFKESKNITQIGIIKYQDIA
ncbi:MAG: type II toxin-antitoxin system MqsA family antitoxin [Sarcina sp.]